MMLLEDWKGHISNAWEVIKSLSAVLYFGTSKALLLYKHCTNDILIKFPMEMLLSNSLHKKSHAMFVALYVYVQYV